MSGYQGYGHGRWLRFRAGYYDVYPSGQHRLPSVRPYAQSGNLSPAGNMFRTVAEWQEASYGQIPVGNPVVGGGDLSSEPIFIGSAHIEDELLPGNVVPSHGCCYVSCNGKERSSSFYHVLMNPSGSELVWIDASDGTIPTGAIQGGKTSLREPLFIGRHHHRGSLIIGKVQASHGLLYITHNGQEEAYGDYEILCCKHVALM